MKAEVLLSCPINDHQGEWRRITGSSEVYNDGYFQRIFAHIGGGGADTPVALFSVSNRPIAMISGSIGSLFGPEHPYAWERKRSGRRGRPSSFNLSFCLPAGTDVIPDAQTLREQAQVLAKRLIQESYETLENTGSTELPAITVELPVPAAPPSGLWGEAAEAVKRGRPFAAIVDDGVSVKPLFPGERFVTAPPLSQPEPDKGGSSRAEERILKKKLPGPPRPTLGMTRIATIGIGTILAVDGILRVRQIYLERELKSFSISSSPDDGEDQRAPASLAIAELVIGAGACFWGIWERKR